MHKSIVHPAQPAHRVISDVRPEMAKADLRKSETDEYRAGIGACLDYARGEARWNLDQLAAALKRDPRQVQRWIAGTERTQVDVVLAVMELRAAFFIAMCRLVNYDVVTRIEIRRTA